MRPGTWREAVRAGMVVLGVAAGGCGGDPSGPSTATGAYDIEIRYLGDVSPVQRQAVEAGVARWRAAVVGDVPSVMVNAEADRCFDGQPAIAELVDDLLLYVQVVPLDGVGGAVAQAGPCYVRSNSTLPLVGLLSFDADDIGNITRSGVLDDVALHELGHVLGIGTLWTPLALLSGSGTDDPQFTGARAGAAYHVLSGVGSTVPVENTGAIGTREGHWREAVFGNELMTGTLGASGNPLSAMTIESLADMGYTTNVAAAGAYSLPSMAVRADAQALPGPLYELRELLIRPQYLD